jgi:hypothetical protein
MTKKLILATVLILSITMVSCTKKPTTTVDENKDTSTSSSQTETNSPKEEETVSTIKLSIYTIDVNSFEPNESSTIEVNESLSLIDKLTELSKAVSEKNFDNLSIEVKSIDTVDGKKIATINLADTDNNKWLPKFQGSTGGSVTSNTLIENFLQSNNKSETQWIDGVKFLYNNEAIESEHVPDLSTIKYRN